MKLEKNFRQLLSSGEEMKDAVRSHD